MKFTKLQSFGNSFIFLAKTELKEKELTRAKIVELCDDHYGIGADGLIIYTSDQISIFNRDGSEAEMCGNALRCLAYLLNKPNQFHVIQTKGGEAVLHHLKNSIKIDFKLPSLPIIEELIFPQFNDLKGFFLTVGVPHLIIFDPPANDLNQLGAKLSSDPRFPNGTNVDFVTKVDKNNSKITTWERGVGLSLSCGTGAMALGIINFYLFKKTSTTVHYRNDSSIKVGYCPHTVSLTGELPKKIAEGKLWY